MKKEQLNNLVELYQRTNDERDLNSIYEVMKGFIEKTVQNMSSRHNMDKHDVESEVYYRIYHVANRYDVSLGDFENVLRTAISNGCKSILRKSSENEIIGTDYADEEGNKRSIFEDKEGANLSANFEEEITEELVKKRDQRQLISELLGKANEKSVQALVAFSESNSYLDAAKRLGTCNKTVERRIRKIAKLFDANRNISDYFTEGNSNNTEPIYVFKGTKKEHKYPIYPVKTYFVEKHSSTY